MEKILYYLNPYRIYYRIYYYLFGKRRIAHPKEVVPQEDAVKCTAELDPEGQKHHNFLYAPVKPLKWLYFKRKFAFRTSPNSPWLLLPRLTPWETKDGQTKFGLNYTFVEKIPFSLRRTIEFITWI